MFKKAFLLLAVSFLLPKQVLAAEALPEAGFMRIGWAIKCSGAMPFYMAAGLLLAALLILLTFIYYKLGNGGFKNE